jgi:hypothetical protein
MGGHLRGKLIFWGGQDRIFKKVMLLICPCRCHRTFAPPGDSPPSQKGGDIPRNIAPLGENIPGISPPRANTLGISPPFRIFAPHICDVVYSDNFVILSFF